jgi:GNAT superfamily N-acetyltransferase
MQEESEKDDEILFKLLVDGKTVSWAKCILYSNLEDIHTASLEKRKGYGRELLAFIEKKAQAHCATLMRTIDFAARNDEATAFFKYMLYEIDSSESGLNASVKATKFLK